MTRTRIWAAITAVLLLLGVAVVAQATLHSSKRAGTIHACVNNTTGKVRIGVQCGPDAHAVSWNKVGPVGPQGPAGPQGPQGPAGLANIHQSTGVTQTIASGASQQIQSTCVNGQAVGGGWTDGTPNALVVATESKVQDANTWQFTFVNFTANPQQVTAYTICVG